MRISKVGKTMLPIAAVAVCAAVWHFANAAPSRYEAVEKIGTTYPIIEKHAVRDIRERLEAKQKSGELSQMQQQVQERINQAALNLQPVDGLQTADKPSVRHFEPSFTLKETLKDHEGRIVAPAGTVVKPLEIAPIPFKIFFFDGRDKKQVSLAKKLAAEWGESFLPVLTAGRWDEIAIEMNRAVYFDQQGRMSRSFRLNEVPSLVAQEGKLLRIETFNP